MFDVSSFVPLHDEAAEKKPPRVLAGRFAVNAGEGRDIAEIQAWMMVEKGHDLDAAMIRRAAHNSLKMTVAGGHQNILTFLRTLVNSAVQTETIFATFAWAGGGGLL